MPASSNERCLLKHDALRSKTELVSIRSKIVDSPSMWRLDIRLVFRKDLCMMQTSLKWSISWMFGVISKLILWSNNDSPIIRKLSAFYLSTLYVLRQKKSEFSNLYTFCEFTNKKCKNSKKKKCKKKIKIQRELELTETVSLERKKRFQHSWFLLVDNRCYSIRYGCYM